MNEIEASMSVLIEVLSILAKDRDKIVVVGGWVPELLFPNRGHIGSLDVDLAIAPDLPSLAYESIRKRLTDAGYSQGEQPNIFIRQAGLGQPTVKVDLITDEPTGATARTHVPIQGMLVWKARGINLALLYSTEIKVEGRLPDGAINSVSARIPLVSAYLCIKAITMSERLKDKDAFDIVFCASNYAGGPKALATQFEPLLGDPLVVEALNILDEKFRTIDHVGPVSAAKIAVERALADNPDIERRRAYEAVRQLVDAIRLLQQRTGT